MGFITIFFTFFNLPCTLSFLGVFLSFCTCFLGFFLEFFFQFFFQGWGDGGDGSLRGGEVGPGEAWLLGPSDGPSCLAPPKLPQYWRLKVTSVLASMSAWLCWTRVDVAPMRICPPL